ncbi:lipase [Vibrio parahaemolyticus]|nr:lipase [Vibrio parahaemolyticus]
MPSLTPKLASEIANIPYGVYQGQGRLAFMGQDGFEKHFVFSQQDVFSGRTGGITGLDRIPLFRKVIPGVMRTSEAFAVIGVGKGKYKGDLVISIRGTQNANDWVTNLNVGLKGAPNGSIAHSGFINSFSSIKPSIKQYLQQCQRLPRRVHCVGHSLGGALASLCSDWLREEYSLRVNLYTFGAPRVGLEQYSRKSSKSNDKVYRCTHGADPVPKVPVWPFIHAPHNGDEYRLDASTGFNISAHSMSSETNLGYLDNANSETWGAIKVRSNKYLYTPTRFNFEHRNQASFTEYWSERIQSALITLLKDAGLFSAIAVQATVSTGMTFYDILARNIEKVAKASKVRESQVKGLLGHMLVFIGKPVTAIEDMSAKFIRNVFLMVFGKLYRAAQMAISAVK